MVIFAILPFFRSFPRVVLEEEPINEANLKKVKVKEVEMGKEEMEERGVEPTAIAVIALDGTDTGDVTTAPRSSK